MNSKTLTIGDLSLNVVYCLSGEFNPVVKIPNPRALQDRGPVSWTKPIQVTLNGFWMATTPVTQSVWRWVMHGNLGHSQLPEYAMSWPSADLFCVKLSALLHDSGQLELNQTVSLPTLMEREYAARAGCESNWFWEDDSDGVAAYFWNSGDLSRQQFHDVGLKKPNPWGLYDLYRMGDEWCMDDSSFIFEDKMYVNPVYCSNYNVDRKVTTGTSPKSFAQPLLVSSVDLNNEEGFDTTVRFVITDYERSMQKVTPVPLNTDPSLYLSSPESVDSSEQK